MRLKHQSGPHTKPNISDGLSRKKQIFHRTRRETKHMSISRLKHMSAEERNEYFQSQQADTTMKYPTTEELLRDEDNVEHDNEVQINELTEPLNLTPNRKAPTDYGFDVVTSQAKAPKKPTRNKTTIQYIRDTQTEIAKLEKKLIDEKLKLSKLKDRLGKEITSQQAELKKLEKQTNG